MTTPFAMRGLKGLWWEPEQYLGWPAFLERAGYDFFMLCYTFCPETGLSWRQPLREPEREIVRRLADDCAARGITLCLALHPLIGGQAWAPEQAAVRFHPTSGQAWFLRYWQARRPAETLRPDPPIRYGSDDDLGLLIGKCREAQALGVGAIALCLDDVDPGSTPDGFSDLAAAHVWLTKGIGDGLQGTEDGALPLSPVPSNLPPRLLVVPTYYWTAGARAHADYTAGLARGLPPDVDVFWTGPEVRTHDITADDAREAAGLFGRKPVVWLNYASNDSFRFAVQLPPDRPPAADLAPETAGLLLNSTRQVGLAHLDALVMGVYLADPTGYDHAQAVDRAVREIVGSEAAPSFLRVLEAWRAVPDVRTLSQDLLEGGRPFLIGLLSRLRPAAEDIKVALAQLQPPLVDDSPEDSPRRQIWQDLAAGSERLRFLVAALEVLAIELAAAGTDRLAPVQPGRARSMVRDLLSARLSTLDPELACDADVVLALGPA
jgi:beta-N-acetylglucosaminidase-like protein